MGEQERYLPTADQFALAAAMAEALEALLPIARLHACHHERDDAWRTLSDLGVFAMTRAENDGGSGLGLVEEALVAFELGRRLVSPAVLASLGTGAHIALADGEAVAAAWTEGDVVILVEEPRATRVLIRGGVAPRVVERPQVVHLLDDIHWAARVQRMAETSERGFVLAREAEVRLRLLDAAALSGLAQTALDMAVDYAGMRQQFGRPIGSFQAIKHHCADMALAARAARDLTIFTAVAVEEGHAEGRGLVDSALIAAGQAAVRNAALNVQIHGGVGFSDEADPHLLVKRARIYLSASGGLDAAVERMAVDGLRRSGEVAA